MSEYLVEVTPGRELLYRTPLALRAAIRSGEITADSRIFHRATSSWVAITEHPEYRKVQAELNPPSWLDPPLPPELVAPPPVRQKRGFFRSLAEIGAALAASGWASITKHLGSGDTKPVTSPKTAVSSKPVSSIQASQPAQQAKPQSSGPTRKRWTFFP